MTASRTSSTLRSSLELPGLVQVVRHGLEARGKHLVGVPLQLGAAWTVVARLDDRIDFDGFDALRLADITRVNPHFLRRGFYVKGLDQKRATIPHLPPLNLDSTAALLRSLQRWFALIVIDREAVNPGACEIGQLKGVSRGSYRIKEVDPSGRWVGRAARYAQAQVTRIGFGGEYEETLAAAMRLPDPKWR